MVVMQTLHGLKRLGHDVLFIEFAHDLRDQTIRYFTDAIAAWWSLGQAALFDLDAGETCVGLETRALEVAAARADAVIQLAAQYQSQPWPVVGHIRPRILIEQDPAYTHLWAAMGDPADIFGEHDIYFTVGGNIGSERCDVPTLGLDWKTTWNSVVLDWWAGEGPVRHNRFSTIAGWHDYGYLEFHGQILGPKAQEFSKFVTLPQLVGEPLEMVLSADPDDPDRREFQQHGWVIHETSVVSTPHKYQEYVRGSLGEFSCAKGGYVGTRSGWFSDRSACYLAAGRPVVLQSTGFEDILPTGAGLFAVKTADEAADAIRAVRADYQYHSRAARELAREHFDSDLVLRSVLAEAGITG
jgi:hypothetical protein